MATPEKDLGEVDLEFGDHDAALHWALLAVKDGDAMYGRHAAVASDAVSVVLKRLLIHVAPYWAFGLFVLQVLLFDLLSSGAHFTSRWALVGQHVLMTAVSMILGLAMGWFVSELPVSGKTAARQIRTSLIVGPVVSVLAATGQMVVVLVIAELPSLRVPFT